VPVEVGSDYRSDGWSQKFMPWDDFLDYLECSHKSIPTEVLYLAQHSLLTQFPALRRDIAVPDYVYACPNPTSDFPDYKPPSNDEQLVTNIWFGPKGTISPAHTVRIIL
jgi:lysine-specific demethylase 8